MTEPISGFLEFRYGLHVAVRVGPGCKTHGDPYLWGGVCAVEGDTAEPLAISTAPVTKAAVSEIRRLLRQSGLKLSWKRLSGSVPYHMTEIEGPNGEIRMGKTNDAMAAVHAHDHVHATPPAAAAAGNKVPGNLINQQTAGATIDAMRELHKAGKSEIVEATTGEFVTSNGLKGYQTLLRAVPVAD